MNIPIEEIRREIPPESYGLRKWLIGKVYLTPKDELCIKRQSQSLREGYDCIDAAVKVREILKKHGESNIYSGFDEKGLWSEHYFVITADGSIVDSTPLYKTIGANHAARNRILQEDSINVDVKNLQSLRLDTYTCVPLRYQKLNETTKSLSRIGVKRIPEQDMHFLRENRLRVPLTEVILELLLLENENPTHGYKIIASFDEHSLYKKLYKSNLSNMTMEEKSKEFRRLLAQKRVNLSGKAYDLKLKGPRNLETKETTSDKVNPIVNEEIEKDMDVLVHLIENIPFASPLNEK
jgi:hypothetical protein